MTKIKIKIYLKKFNYIFFINKKHKTKKMEEAYQPDFYDVCNESLANLKQLKIKSDEDVDELIEYIELIRHEDIYKNEDKYNVDDDINLYIQEIQKFEKRIATYGIDNAKHSVNDTLILNYEKTLVKIPGYFNEDYYYGLWKFLKTRLLELYYNKIGNNNKMTLSNLYKEQKEMMQEILNLDRNWRNTIDPSTSLAEVTMLQAQDLENKYPKKDKRFPRKIIKDFIKEFETLVTKRRENENKLNKLKQTYDIEIQNILLIEKELESKPVMFEKKEEESFDEMSESLE